MICPQCRGQAGVTDTWYSRAPYVARVHDYPREEGVVRRRRKCKACGIKFITEEKIVRQL